jgi:hypothetical protein
MEERKKNGRDIYLESIEKFKKKKPYYRPVERMLSNSNNSKNKTKGQRTEKSYYIDTKTGVMVYLEKHHILPKHQNGDDKPENIVLLTFPQHVMAHYLRFLQYENQKDRLAVRIMLSQDNGEIRREMASYAGKLGGKQQQKNLHESNRGWYNPQIQEKLGKKGAASAKLKEVGAFDPQNLLDAGVAWKEKFQKDGMFQDKMLKNLRKGLGTQAQLGVNIYDSKSQRYRVINVRGTFSSGPVVTINYWEQEFV